MIQYLSMQHGRPTPRRKLRACWGILALLLGLFAFPALGATTNAAVSAFPDRNNPPMTLGQIMTGDVLQMKVYQEDDLNTQATVDASGAVTLPLLGSVMVRGMLSDEAAKTIRDLYEKDYLVNPQVTVEVTSRVKRRFTVLGQVNRPGIYEYPPEKTINLLEAVAMSGGFTRLASPSKVTVQRNINGQSNVLRVDADAMTRDKKQSPMDILPDDVISVGERLL